MTAGQFIHLVQALRLIAETATGFLATKMLKVQIDLVVEVGRKIMTWLGLRGQIAKTALRTSTGR